MTADDGATLLHTMVFTLKRKGCEVVIEEDGESAYKEIMESYQNDKLYDLIIYVLFHLTGLNYFQISNCNIKKDYYENKNGFQDKTTRC